VTLYSFFSKDIKIVPILVGNLDQAAELEYGDKIAPFLAQEGTIAIVSSDFCHWFVVSLLLFIQLIHILKKGPEVQLYLLLS